VEGNGRGTVAEAGELAARPDVDFVPTAPEQPNLLQSRRARIARRAFMVVLFAFLAVGLTGRLGVHTRTATAQGGGYEMTMTYGQVSRAGLATPWSLEIHHPGGFDGPVTVATNSTYLDLLDENGFDPQPSKATATGDEVIWEFDPPDGDTLGISLDGRIEPGAQWGRTGVTSVLVDGHPVVTVKYKTWVMP
jgi:sulfur carrier protein ThiS